MTSNRQRYFTVHEELAQLLQEEDEDFYGGRSEESLDNDETPRGSRLSSAVRSGISGKHSSDLDENDEGQEHLLNRQVDPKDAAACDFDQEPSASSSDDNDGGERGRGLTGGEVSRTQVTRHQCGCEKHGLFEQPLLCEKMEFFDSVCFAGFRKSNTIRKSKKINFEKNDVTPYSHVLAHISF